MHRKAQYTPHTHTQMQMLDSLINRPKIVALKEQKYCRSCPCKKIKLTYWKAQQNGLAELWLPLLMNEAWALFVHTAMGMLLTKPFLQISDEGRYLGDVDDISAC